MSDYNNENVEDLTDWEKEPSIEDFINDLNLAKTSHDAHVATLDMYSEFLNVTGQAAPKKVKGRSSVQPKTIKKLAEWRIPSLTEPFLAQYDLFKISPKTWKDKEGALQNQALLNYQFNNVIDKTKFINKLIRTLYHKGTVALRVGWHTETGTQEQVTPHFLYLPATPEQSNIIQQYAEQLGELGIDSPLFEQIENIEIKESVKQFLTTQQFVAAKFTGETKEVIEVETVNKPIVEVVSTKDLYIDPSCGDDLEKAQFIIYGFYTSKSELLKDGRYKNIGDISINTFPESSFPSAVADLDTDESKKLFPDGKTFSDEARAKLRAYEYWGFYDIHGTGETVPIVATFIGNTIIRMEENPYPDKKLPFIIIPYTPVENSIYGEADAELIKDNQSIIGATTRGMIDHLARSSNGQTGIATGFLSAVNKLKFEKGQDYEFNPLNGANPDNSIVQNVSREIPSSYINILTLHSNESEAMTGIKSFDQGLNSASYGDVATGVKGVLSATAKRELSIIRRISAGLCLTAKKVIAMNSAWISDEEVIRVTDDEYVAISRDSLKGDYDLELTISSDEEDNKKAQELSFMLQTLGNTVPFPITKEILIDIAVLRKMPDLAHRLKKFEPQPDPMEEAKKQLELAELEAKTAKAKASALESEVKAAYYQAQIKRLEVLNDQSTLNFVEQESGIQHERALDVMKAQAEAQTNMHVAKIVTQAAVNNLVHKDTPANEVEKSKVNLETLSDVDN